MTFNVDKVNWEKVKKPNDLFSWFIPDPKDPIEWQKKLMRFKKYLMDKYLYASDEYRKPQMIDQITQMYFFGGSFNLFYELGDFQGLVGFLNILPGFKASVMFKIWDKEAWTKSNARAIQELSDVIMDNFKLERLETSAPDRRMVKLSKLMGFKVEGEKPKDFKWNGRLYTNYQLGKVRNEPKPKTDTKPQGTTKTTTEKKTKPKTNKKKVSK